MTEDVIKEIPDIIMKAFKVASYGVANSSLFDNKIWKLNAKPVIMMTKTMETERKVMITS